MRPPSASPTEPRGDSTAEPTAYIDAVRKLDRGGLVDLWEGIRRRDTPGFPPGKALEHLVLRAFDLEEVEVTWPYSVRLGQDDAETEQIDGAVVVDGVFAILEAKDYDDAHDSGRVKFEPIAKMRSQLLRRPGLAIGVVFSTNGFTEPAKILARFVAPQTILLWDGDDLDFALAGAKMRHGFRRKLRHAVEHGLPDYDLREREGDR
jgi:hypothetical protein